MEWLYSLWNEYSLWSHEWKVLERNVFMCMLRCKIAGIDRRTAESVEQLVA